MEKPSTRSKTSTCVAAYSPEPYFHLNLVFLLCDRKTSNFIYWGNFTDILTLLSVCTEKISRPICVALFLVWKDLYSNANPFCVCLYGTVQVYVLYMCNKAARGDPITNPVVCTLVLRPRALTWFGSCQQLCMWFWEETCPSTAGSTLGCWVRNTHTSTAVTLRWTRVCCQKMFSDSWRRQIKEVMFF